MIRVELVMPSTKGMGAETMELLRPMLREFIREAMVDLQNRIKGKVSGTGRGRIYKRGGQTHQASAPGDPPARDQGSAGSAAWGSYSNSWNHDWREKPTFIEGRVGSSMWRFIGRFLEWGTKTIKPRPHVGNSVIAWKRDIEARIARAGGG